MSHDLVQTAVTTVLLYTTALVLVRVIGLGLFSQLAAFDALITIARRRHPRQQHPRYTAIEPAVGGLRTPTGSFRRTK